MADVSKIKIKRLEAAGEDIHAHFLTVIKVMPAFESAGVLYLSEEAGYGVGPHRKIYIGVGFLVRFPAMERRRPSIALPTLSRLYGPQRPFRFLNSAWSRQQSFGVSGIDVRPMKSPS
jgi:hypothetical protein